MTTLRLYNTLTKTKEDFVPLDANNVRIYVCGPTVYDYAHIGNARPVIVFDVLYRLLRHVYGADHVTYVRNITDIDDKINARAASEGVPIREITEKTARQYNEDVAALGCLPPTIAPRATDNVEEMIAMIARLIAAGHAYQAQGHVLFDVSSKPDYGKLARRSLDEMIAGARVDIAPYKKSPMDFVLWKPSDDATPGWESPWGRGRPGWHIECSAMIEATMGDTIDIHGGGIDLVFPHHENEIAQSEGAHRDHPLAKIWMHNGFLQVEGEKMSKSLGNFVTINELLTGDIFGGRPWHGGVLRLSMLKSHYRKPMDWTVEQLRRSRFEMDKFQFAASSFGAHKQIRFAELAGQRFEPDQRILSALANDLDTPLAIAHLHEVAEEARADLGAAMKFLATLEFLGLMDRHSVETYATGGPMSDIAVSQILRQHDDFSVVERIRVSLANHNEAALNRWKSTVENWGVHVSIDEFCKLEFEVQPSEEADEHKARIEFAIASRLAARRAKDFKESDRIRDELLAQGIVLKDNADGTTDWEVK